MALTELEFGTGYPKINAIWKRNPKGNRVIPGAYASPWFEELMHARWVWAEKIDGTNIGFRWLPTEDRVIICGKTANASFPGDLIEKIEWIANPEVFRRMFGDTHVKVFGEGFGPGIQQNGGGYRPDKGFILFDVQKGTEAGLTPSSPFLGGGPLHNVAEGLGVEIVKVIDTCTLAQAWSHMVDREYESTYPNHVLEGVVGRPETPYYVRTGNDDLKLVQCKLKYVDVDALEG
jgi:hypothetical protein